jgi:hypothetical protein
MLIYIRINETPAFILYVSFFSILFCNKFVLEQRNYFSEILIFRDFIIRILNFLLGIRLIYMAMLQLAGLIVANHRSYFDQ